MPRPRPLPPVVRLDGLAHPREKSPQPARFTKNRARSGVALVVYEISADCRPVALTQLAALLDVDSRLALRCSAQQPRIARAGCPQFLVRSPPTARKRSVPKQLSH